MARRDETKRSHAAFEQDTTLVAVVEVSQSSWLVAAAAPGVERRPRKKLVPDPQALLALLHRWRDEAAAAGAAVRRIVVAYEAGRDGFWLARWLRAHDIEAHVIHASSVAVPRERRRAKTDRLDAEMLMRALLGWLRGEPGHCSMAAVPTQAEEDARRPGRERDALVTARTRETNRIKAALARLGVRGFDPRRANDRKRLDEVRTPKGEPIPPNTRAEIDRGLERLAQVNRQIAAIEKEREARLETADDPAADATRLLARVRGVGVETADMIVREVVSRDLRDRRAVGRFAGLTGAPDESGTRRREQGLSRSGSPRVRGHMIQLAWRWLMFQPESALARWFRERTVGAMPVARRKMAAALARKLLVALWRLATAGELPAGVVMRAA